MLFWYFNIFVCVFDNSACAYVSKGHKREPGVLFYHCLVFETVFIPEPGVHAFSDRLETSKPQKTTLSLPASELRLQGSVLDSQLIV